MLEPNMASDYDENRKTKPKQSQYKNPNIRNGQFGGVVALMINAIYSHINECGSQQKIKLLEIKGSVKANEK